MSGELRSSAWLVILHKGNQSSFQRSSSEPYIVEAIWNRLVALSSSQSPSNAQGRVLRVYVNQCGTESETKSLTRTNCVGNGTQCGQPQSQDAFPCHLFKGSSLLLYAFEEENSLHQTISEYRNRKTALTRGSSLWTCFTALLPLGEPCKCMDCFKDISFI